MAKTISDPIIKEFKIVTPEPDTLVTEVTALFERLNTGDEFAFTELYDKTQKYVYYTIVKAGVSGANVEDVMQEVFVTVFKNYKSCADTKKALAWIKKIAYNKSIDFLRKESKTVLATEDEEEYIFEDSEFSASMQLPEDIMENKETQRLMAEILNKLPKQQLDIIRAYYFSEMKTKEIAEAFGIPEGTVKTNLARGRKTIEKEVMELARKHGTKLFAVALTVFLGRYFALEAYACELPVETSAKVFTEAVAKSGVKAQVKNLALNATKSATQGLRATAGTVGKVTVGAGVKTGATVLGKTLVTKILIAALAVTTVGGSVVAGVIVSNSASVTKTNEALVMESTAGAADNEIAGELSNDIKDVSALVVKDILDSESFEVEIKNDEEIKTQNTAESTNPVETAPVQAAVPENTVTPTNTLGATTSENTVKQYPASERWERSRKSEYRIRTGEDENPGDITDYQQDFLELKPAAYDESTEIAWRIMEERYEAWILKTGACPWQKPDCTGGKPNIVKDGNYAHFACNTINAFLCKWKLVLNTDEMAARVTPGQNPWEIMNALYPAPPEYTGFGCVQW